MKKLFFISLGLLVLTILFLVIYNFVFKKPASTPPPTSQEIVPEQREPIATTDKISRITSARALSAVLSGEDAVIFFDQDSEEIVRANVRGSTSTSLLNPRLSQIIRADWAAEGTRALITTNAGSKYALDLTAGTTIPLSSDIDYARLAVADDTIISKKFNQATSTRSLAISRTDGSQEKQLAAIPFRRVSFTEIPGSILLAYWPDPNAFVASELFAVSTVSPGDPKPIMSGLFGADYSFSPDGDNILISSTLEEGGGTLTLGTANASGGQYRNLNIPTMISKAAWGRDNATVYYAQPTGIPEGSVLPNDYTEGAFMTRDTFWKVDTTTGKRSRLIELDELPEKIDATNLMLAPDETVLYFINRINGFIYRLNI